MSTSITPSSILDLLTCRNPTVQHVQPKAIVNTKSHRYAMPRRIKEWKELHDLESLRRSFKGNLMRAALKDNRILQPLPHLHHDTHCVIRNHKDCERYIHCWTEAIVNSALLPIRNEFNAAIWVQGDPVPQKPSLELPMPAHPEHGRRRPPPRNCRSVTKKPKSKARRQRNLEPDSGASSPAPSLLATGPSTIVPPPTGRERFVKEYKQATHWGSTCLKELFDGSGAWIKGKERNKYAWPIRQAFTYCVQSQCRYGCILTCQEAFIFRVRPQEERPSDGSADRVLSDRITNNALMEYIAIPSETHAEGDPRNLDKWTINLALWFLHVLSGNNFEADWTYKPLCDEDVNPCMNAGEEASDRPRGSSWVTADAGEEQHEGTSTSGEMTDGSESGTSEASVPTVANESFQSRKRKADSEDEDGYIHSFATRSPKRSFTKAAAA